MKYDKQSKMKLVTDALTDKPQRSGEVAAKTGMNKATVLGYLEIVGVCVKSTRPREWVSAYPTCTVCTPVVPTETVRALDAFGHIHTLRI